MALLEVNGLQKQFGDLQVFIAQLFAHRLQRTSGFLQIQQDLGTLGAGVLFELLKFNLYFFLVVAAESCRFKKFLVLSHILSPFPC